MASRLATDSGLRPAGGDPANHACLTPARHLLVTTFGQAGSPVSAPVPVAADGDRTYFQTWNRSSLSKRLRHTDWVQVVPCSVLGLYSYGQSLDATVRQLAGEEAQRAAELLTGNYPAPQKFFVQLVRRIRGGQMVHYELQADEPSEAATNMGTES